MKQFFFIFIIRPIVLLIAGVYVKGQGNLPKKDASIVVSNHNSHLDTMVLMSLYPISRLPFVRPVAASDYFMKNPFLAWFSLNIIGILPFKRKLTKEAKHPFAEVYKALQNNETIILFPEGSRGKPEEMKTFKTGIAHLATAFPTVPIVPIYIYGAGKALPRGEAILVPFIIEVVIGQPIYIKEESNKAFTHRLETTVHQLKKEIRSTI